MLLVIFIGLLALAKCGILILKKEVCLVINNILLLSLYYTIFRSLCIKNVYYILCYGSGETIWRINLC